VAAHKLDIFETLAAIDRRDKDFYSTLTEEARKGFAPPVVLRWASAVRDGPNSEHYIWLVNERVNVNFHDIWDHPELQYKLLASCGTGKNERNHQWVAMAGKMKKADKVRTFIGQFWPDANDTELYILLNQFTDESFEDFVLSSGSTPDEIKEVMEAYGRLTGKAVKPKGKKPAKPKT
jgi:hypothetical protein